MCRSVDEVNGAAADEAKDALSFEDTPNVVENARKFVAGVIDAELKLAASNTLAAA